MIRWVTSLGSLVATMIACGSHPSDPIKGAQADVRRLCGSAYKETERISNSKRGSKTYEVRGCEECCNAREN